MKSITDPSPLSPHALTQELARANKLSFDSLDANHAGQLSSQQMRVVLETFGFAILIPILFLGMAGAGLFGIDSLQRGWSTAEFGRLVQGGVFLLVAVLLLVGIGLLVYQTKRSGVDKYLSQRRVLQLFLMPIDLVRGQVASIEGSTTPQVDEKKSHDNTGEEIYQYYYSYQVAGKDFEVDKEGYNALPEFGAQCRIYYLPLSKALLNIEVMDTGPVRVKVPAAAVENIQAPSQSASFDRRAQRVQGRTEVADSIIRPLGILGARIAFGSDEANKIQSDLAGPLHSKRLDLTSSPVYTQALQVACADSRVLAALGRPIQPLSGVTGSTRRINDMVVTDLVIPIKSAQKQGKLYATARQDNGELEFYRLEVQVDGKSEVIPLGN